MRRLLSASVSIAFVSIAATAHAQPAAAYRIESPVPRDLQARFSDVEIGILEKLNRADRDRMGKLPRLVLPEQWFADEGIYSPLPRRYGAASAIRKLLVVHLPGQVFAAYESGELVRWGPVSSGAAETATPAGLYHLNWRATGHVSSVNPDWFMPWYFNYDNGDGRAFHEYDLPGLPASHGCIRLLRRDAQWLFGWGDEWRLDARGAAVIQPGTPVLIVGDYDFAASPPWRSPSWLSQPVTLPASMPAP